MTTLVVEKRNTGKVGKKELQETQVPGVVYGKDVTSTPVVVDFNVVKKVFRAVGYNQIVNLDLAGEKHEVLFKDVDLDPVTNNIAHFDMYALKRGEKVTVEVPVHLIGESPAEQQGKHIVILATTVEVTTVPSKLPEGFDVDKSSLVEVGDTLTVADIKTGDKDIEIITDLETALAKAEEVVEMKVEDDTAEVELPEAEHGAEADVETTKEA